MGLQTIRHLEPAHDPWQAFFLRQLRSGGWKMSRHPVEMQPGTPLARGPGHTGVLAPGDPALTRPGGMLLSWFARHAAGLHL